MHQTDVAPQNGQAAVASGWYALQSSAQARSAPNCAQECCGCHSTCHSCLVVPQSQHLQDKVAPPAAGAGWGRRGFGGCLPADFAALLDPGLDAVEAAGLEADAGRAASLDADAGREASLDADAGREASLDAGFEAVPAWGTQSPVCLQVRRCACLASEADGMLGTALSPRSTCTACLQSGCAGCFLMCGLLRTLPQQGDGR